MPILKTLRLDKQERARILIILGVFIGVSVLCYFDALKRFELVTYDYRFILKGTRPADPRIAVIEISDDSITKIGRWPWERSWHAALIKILHEAGAKAVVFDVVFSETSDPQKDAVLAQAIKESNIVYLAKFAEVSPSTKKITLLESLPEFTSSARGGGHINLQPDIDGVMRRIPLLVDLEGERLPQLSVSVALDLYGVPLADLHIEGRNLKIPLKNGEMINVPLDARRNYIINWAGRWGDVFAHFSYADVVKSYAVWKKGGVPEIPIGFFKDKVCYVGTTAAGLFDIRPTSLEPSYPAVGVNLTVLNNLLERRFIKPLSNLENSGILFVLMFIIYWILKLPNFSRAAFFTVILAVVYLAAAAAIFIFWGIWVNVIYAIVLILVTYLAITFYNQISIVLERAKLLKLATRDSLTGLYNVGHFKLLLKAEITTISMRREKNLSIVMSDVDNFKKTNDTYGHVTGDTVLKEVAEAFKSNCRALDVAARYGGEEFILMLPGADADIAYKIADKIRKAVNDKVFPNEKGSFSTSVSLGVTQVSPDDRDIEAVVARADRALYEAKHAGKNRVVIASDSPKVNVTTSPPAS